MRLGAHLPLADFGTGVPSGSDLLAYAGAARDLGFDTLAANDHLVWRHPWLDGPTALASVMAAAGDMVLATTVALPVVRHPVVVAKMLTTLASLAQGSVIAGLGPGSSQSDFRAVGIPFEERWARFDESLRLVRALVRGEKAQAARFYQADSSLAPLADPPPQVWSGSWGSDRRLASLAAVADGWLASAYNATPDEYGEKRARLDTHLRAAGRDPDGFPDAVATAWLHVTDSREQAERMRTDVLAPALNRDPATLEHLPIGSAEHCSEVLSRYAAAGAREVLVWPLGDPIDQLERCAALAASLG